MPKRCLVLLWHEDAAKEWCNLGAQDLTAIAISYEPQINAMELQGERTRVGMRWEGETDKGGAVILREVQGGRSNGQSINGVYELVRRLGKVAVPAESREDKSAHDFWKRGTTSMFDMIIVSLNAVSYLRMTPKKALAKAEKDQKDLYLQAFLDHRHSITPIF